MNLNELKIKNNENMQNFCALKINELSNYQHMYEKQIKDKAYIWDYKELCYKIGQCKIEREYFSYFLYLLQEDYKRIENKKEKENIQIKIKEL